MTTSLQERRREAQARYRKTHPDKVAAMYAAWIARPENKARRRKTAREYRSEQNPKIREQEKAWLEGRPLYHAVRRAKRRAKALGLPFDLDYRTILQPEFCPVLGIRLNYKGGNGGPTPDSPSLDRFHPELGYVTTNVRVISFRANTIKNDATIEDLERVLAYMRRH